MRNYFESIYGNKETISYFETAIENGKLAHAYILEGPKGSGKRTLAKAIAATRVKNSEFAEKIPGEQSPDVLYFGLVDKKKTVGVDTIRSLKSAVYIKPSELDAKFFVLSDCQYMTVQAQNAALKILEEPPANVYFFLLTDSASALLPTVRSRAQIIRMQQFGKEQMQEYALTQPRFSLLYKQDPHRFGLILQKAGGCIGQLSDEGEGKEEVKLLENARQLVSLLDGADYMALLRFCQKLAATRQELDALLLKVQNALRDVLACRYGQSTQLFFYESEESAMAATRHLTDRSILCLLSQIEQIKENLVCNPNLRGVQTLLADKLSSAMQN